MSPNTTSHLDPDTTQHIHPLPGANDDPPPAAALPKGSAWNTDLRTEPPSINVRAAWSTKKGCWNVEQGWRTREEPHTLPSGYEKVAEAVYSVYPKKDMSDSAQTAVNLGSGLIAGFAAAIVSQPADTMLSKINKYSSLVFVLSGPSTTPFHINIISNE
ncbi:hypothetical protein QR685DRAFT_553433 [Neurospora intermedia]|uniref:Uncharacterized protein n=1 Tax=Neurospora intermedia TaxID=5142 RepID=A0ABR3DCP8_NEUIN